jgi:hypothetical protein
MYENLETAANPEKLKRIVVDPVSRVEDRQAKRIKKYNKKSSVI